MNVNDRLWKQDETIARLKRDNADMLAALRAIVAELPGFGHDDEPSGIDRVALAARAIIARIDGAS